MECAGVESLYESLACTGRAQSASVPSVLPPPRLSVSFNSSFAGEPVDLANAVSLGMCPIVSGLDPFLPPR